MADAETMSQTSKLLTMPCDLVSLSNMKEVAIVTAGSYGVVNRKMVKSRSVKMLRAILSCRQINKEIKPYALFTKIVAQACYDCTHVRPMEVPTYYCSTIKHLTVNDLWMIKRPALLEPLPHLERLHFFDKYYKISLMVLFSLEWATTEDGTHEVVGMVLAKLCKHLGSWPQAMLKDQERTFAMTASATIDCSDFEMVSDVTIRVLRTLLTSKMQKVVVDLGTRRYISKELRKHK
jgi:hypothetical protein